MKKPIVAIDGPAGSGKSTVAKIVAKELGFVYIDSGAMYRTLALKALKLGLPLDDENKMTAMASGTAIELKFDNGLHRVFSDGADVSREIRTEEVSAKTKIVAAHGGVRKIIRTKQQEIGALGGVVMEGRDIGTQVFPQAEYKFYLDASVEERASRRFKEQMAKGEKVDLENIKAQIIDRDEKDRTRHESPLKAADDAEVVDTTKLSIDDVARLIVSRVAKDERALSVSSSWMFYAGRFMFWLFFKTLWRLKIEGQENIPKTGGVLIAPNHMDYIDPPLTGSSMARPLHFMAKSELFDVPVLGFLIKRTNAFPVKRGRQDVGAFRNALRLLEAGEPLLVFPEGTRSKDGNFGKARPGLGMMACMAQVPAIPVRIINSNGLWSFKRLEVIFGKPIFPPKEYTRQSYNQFSETVLEEIKKLKKL